MFGEMAQAAASTANTMMNIGAQLYSGRRQQAAANAQAAAAMQFERENMFHQNRVAIDMMHDQQAFNSGEAAISRDWQAGQAGITRDWNAQQAGIERTFNAEEAAKNRAFQEEMANTAWQRGTKDMQAAGINPMLAFSKGGADTPAGSAASAGAASSSAPSGATASSGMASPSGTARAAMAQQLNYIGSAISSGLQGATMLANIDNIKAQTRKTEAEATTQEAVSKGGVLVNQDGSVTVLGSGLRQHAETLTVLEKLKQAGYEVTTAKNTAAASAAQPERAKTELELKKLEIPKAKADAAFEQQVYDMFKGAGSASGIERIIKLVAPFFLRGMSK